MNSRELLATAVLAAPAATAAIVALSPRRLVAGIAIFGAVLTGSLSIALAVAAIVKTSGAAVTGQWIIVDPAGGLLVGVIGLVGLASFVASPSYLASTTRSIVADTRRPRVYYAVLYCFWVVLLAVPLAANLGAAWLLVEATTAISALLVGFSGRSRALEAGWKYLILTSLGLGLALLGIVILATGVPSRGLGALTWDSLSNFSAGRAEAILAYLMLLIGLATKVGWAPVHNWLPDAHSEAPPPVSAMLSAALLPAVLLVAWRCERALAPVIGEGTAQGVLIAFGLASLLVAVPFLWQSQAWKRLLAYSSLEHMGIIALGVSFGSTLALAGAAVHVVGHAIAKSLGFYAATPLLALDPRAGRHAAVGVARAAPKIGVAMGIALGALAAIPPSPLFVSEVMIVAGGFSSGHRWAAGAAAILLALVFVGLMHALLESTLGKAPLREHSALPGARTVSVLSVCATGLMLALACAAALLPGTEIVVSLAGAVR